MMTRGTKNLKNEMALGIPRTVLCKSEMILAHTCAGNFQARYNNDKNEMNTT
jgi:hypothetical protein